jgi:hypothetical protein
MAGNVQLQVPLDESTREQLRHYAGASAESIGWAVAQIVESGLARSDRFAAGLNRRVELAMEGNVPEHPRAGAVPVSIGTNAALKLADLSPAFDLSAAATAGLVVKVVLSDGDWTTSILSAAIGSKMRSR